MDEFDRAQELEMRQREQAISRQRRQFAALATALHAEADPNCQECGEHIPLARRAAIPGATLCVDCQAVKEQQQRMNI